MRQSTVQGLRALKLDEQVIIPWHEVTGRPEGEGWFGFKHYVFHSYPTDDGLVVKRIAEMPPEAEKNKKEYVVQGNPHPDWK